jgi:hypothetical protein
MVPQQDVKRKFEAGANANVFLLHTSSYAYY